MAFSLPPNFQSRSASSCRRRRDPQCASTLSVIEEDIRSTVAVKDVRSDTALELLGDHSSLRDVERRLRRVSVEEGDMIDGSVGGADLNEVRGKNILQELGVPPSDIELLLADPDGKLDAKFMELEQELSHFSLEESWSKHFDGKQKRSLEEKGRSKLTALGLPPSDLGSLL